MDRITTHLELDMEAPKASKGKGATKKLLQGASPNVGKATPVKVPDFSDPNRRETCLERDFPITAVNQVAANEGNAGKPIYQMSKWWARRRSSVFRAALIAAATEAPGDGSAAKHVWDTYYANHQKAGNFRNLRVLDPFMGGGTTLVEGARLGFNMYGQDLNPVAWFIVRNEIARTDSTQVKEAFTTLEQTVKPILAPFYTTTCPRGHQGSWIDERTGKPAKIDPINIDVNERVFYQWYGPELVYTFWSKHGTCTAIGCNHRTPVMRSQRVAEKKLTVQYLGLNCPNCGHEFQAELGETRMAPGSILVKLETEPSSTVLSQPFAQRLQQYSQGNKGEKLKRVSELLETVEREPGLLCPNCDNFAGTSIKTVLNRHFHARTVAEVRKKDFDIQSRHLHMTLLLTPESLTGASANVHDQKLGGYIGAPVDSTEAWYLKRTKTLEFVEIHGRLNSDENSLDESIETEDGTADEDQAGSNQLPPLIILPDGRQIPTDATNVPAQSTFTCQSCGRPNDFLDAVKQSGHSAAVSPYAVQCYCPQCKEEGYNYSGRYFKVPDVYDIERLVAAEREWDRLAERDLADYWPKQSLPYAWMTHHLNGGIPNWGYTHWWKMFNPRQLLDHAVLLKTITEMPAQNWSLSVTEQVLGAFQQYLRNQNMFCFWNMTSDKLEPMMSNANYHPKASVIENNSFAPFGRGNWVSCAKGVVEGLEWCEEPWEKLMTPGGKTKSTKVNTGDAVLPGTEVRCGSSTDLGYWGSEFFDLVITDPPFGDNVFYADLADFFYVWLRIPLGKWYSGQPEAQYWDTLASPRTLEAIKNRAEHPDTRTEDEKKARVSEPADDFYQSTLTACWYEANQVLKPGGILAFTFHHSAHEPWVGVLQSLFDAGYILLATYPVRSDETKGEGGAFGSRKIEYDILHVCRKRQDEPKRVSWARMRSWVKNEVAQLRNILEIQDQGLNPADIRVILIGKALEFFSKHYGQVYIGDEPLTVREALIGIDQLLGESEDNSKRTPEGAEPITALFLSYFRDQSFMLRDDLHKMLRGVPVTVEEFIERGWLHESNRVVSVIPVSARFEFWRQRKRELIRTDLDQAHFLIGAAYVGSSVNIEDELNRQTFRLKPSVDAILSWYAETDRDEEERESAARALRLLQNWRRDQQNKPLTNEDGSTQTTLWEYEPNRGEGE